MSCEKIFASLKQPGEVDLISCFISSEAWRSWHIFSSIYLVSEDSFWLILLILFGDQDMCHPSLNTRVSHSRHRTMMITILHYSGEYFESFNNWTMFLQSAVTAIMIIGWSSCTTESSIQSIYIKHQCSSVRLFFHNHSNQKFTW